MTMHTNTPGAGNVEPLDVPAGADWREPKYPEWMVVEFIGWLAAEFPELHAVEVPRLMESWREFKAVHAGRGFSPNGEG